MKCRSPWVVPARHTRTLLLVLLTSLATGCVMRHHASVQKSTLPPPPGPKVVHTNRLLVHVTDASSNTQCLAYEKHHPVCFDEIRSALQHGLVRSLWPSFPEVVIASAKDATPSDYLLQVEVTLDALPPDDAGPGWSAGARSRFRLIREGKVLDEQTLSSRSRAHFAYGAPLGEGATEVIDATVNHIAVEVSQIPESRPDLAKPLPLVASRQVTAEKKTKIAEAKKNDEADSQPQNAKNAKNAKSRSSN